MGLTPPEEPMSDNDLQAKDALEPSSSDDGQTTPASAAAQDADAEKKQTSSKKVNLQEFQEFKDYQRQTDQQRAALEREATTAKQTAAALKARLEALEDQAYGKDDYGKMQLAAQRAAREAEAARKELEEYRTREAVDAAKREAIQKVADRYKVPAAELMDAKDYDDLIDKAIEARDRQREAKQKEREETRQANAPDLGGGGRSTAKTRAEQEYEDAFTRGDSVMMARKLREIREQSQRK